MARLIINSPDGRRGILELSKPVISIGRGTANDLVLNDTSVSRFHAVINRLEDGTVAIADRGSTNGVIVNGKKIAGETTIAHGDRARIGVYSLLVGEVNDTSLVVKRADIPGTLNNVLKNVGPALSIRQAP